MNRRTLLGLVSTFAFGGCLSDLPGGGPPVNVECPALSDTADSLCAHTADPPLALRPSSWHLKNGSGVSPTFTLENESDRSAEFVSFPSLKRRTDDGWEHVWPMVLPPLEHSIEPGDSYSWEFALYTEETTGDADETVHLYALDPGMHAMVVNAELGDRTVQCVAPFEVGDGEET